jgi:putative ABC transport system ATP-binding protein
MLACIAGLDEPDGGMVRIAGRPMSRRPERQRSATRAGAVGVVLQSGNLVEHLTVRTNLRIAHRLGGARAVLDSDALLTRVGIAGRAGAYPSQLSGGEAVRAGLAVALVNQPALVVADEPTAEVDRGTEATLLELLRAEADRGVALIVATHSPIVAAAADRILTLADGRVAA